jgi:hypothetical protein
MPLIVSFDLTSSPSIQPRHYHLNNDRFQLIDRRSEIYIHRHGLPKEFKVLVPGNFDRA